MLRTPREIEKDELKRKWKKRFGTMKAFERRYSGYEDRNAMANCLIGYWVPNEIIKEKKMMKPKTPLFYMPWK